ncbi:MAG: hypothetical protein ABIN67_19155 [Ferruginibacter sp.]
MSFIKVTADPCTGTGNTSSQVPRAELHLNIDLIGAFATDEVLLKSGHIVNLGNHYYRNFKLAKGAKIPAA